MSNWLSRIRSDPVSAPITNSLDASWLSQLPSSPRAPPQKPRDPNAPEYRYQVTQKLIYERRLPGGSYITAHVQRLQSGFYDSPVIHEDCIDNVRFVAINFVFHPSSSTFRFKSAEINIALHHTGEANKNPLQIVNVLAPRSFSHDHGTQTETIPQTALVKSEDCLHIAGFKPSKPRFLRHAPHLLYGSISPENLNWNFNLAGSLGVSQGPASASLKPSYGVKSSYKVYDMMKIQGSMRTLRSWAGHDYDIEDGELVWTLEENKLQKSGLPREFTFVMLLTKGSGGFEESGDVRLEVDVRPKVMGRLGTSYPSVITNLHQYQPFKKGILDLDEEIGQVFEPQKKGKGFNFATIASSFDDFVWLPGNAYSTSEPAYSSTGNAQQQGQIQSPAQAHPGNQSSPQQPSRKATQQALPQGDTTVNLRVILESARGTPIPMPLGLPLPQAQHMQTTAQQMPQFTLKIPSHPSRNNSPLPTSSAGRPGSRHSTSGTKRTITIGSTKSVRKQRSRGGLAREFTLSSSPEMGAKTSRNNAGTDAVNGSTEDDSLERFKRRNRASNADGTTKARPFSYQEGDHSRDYGMGSYERGRSHSHDRDDDPQYNHATQTTAPDSEFGDQLPPLQLTSSPSQSPPLSRVHKDVDNYLPRDSPEYVTPPAHPNQPQRSKALYSTQTHDHEPNPRRTSAHRTNGVLPSQRISSINATPHPATDKRLSIIQYDNPPFRDPRSQPVSTTPQSVNNRYHSSPSAYSNTNPNPYSSPAPPQQGIQAQAQVQQQPQSKEQSQPRTRKV